MAELDLDRVRAFVNENIGLFHRQRLDGIEKLDLRRLLKRKNPYLFRAKNMSDSNAFVGSILEALLPASEEEKFGHFLEELAIFINQMAYGGKKSSSTGIDLDFERDGERYLVAVKSGPNWGNSSQQKKLQDNFKTALKVVRQSASATPTRAVLGTCYGKCINKDNGLYLKLCGQAFWSFISGNSELFVSIIEPIGYRAEWHNAQFDEALVEARNRLLRDLLNEFCDARGSMDWEKLVRFNSGVG